MASGWFQKTISLKSRPRGFHLVSDEIVQKLPEIRKFKVGLCHLFIQHTSAGLTLNENADPSVRSDMRAWFETTVDDDTPYFTHTYEGPDDMSAHIKTTLTGNQLTIPITDGRLAMGTWQGIYLCEYRDMGGSRRIVCTIQGQ
ncbi:Uncharacterized protein family UPF0047 [Carpediemonas membranifera]|uniref:Uncharacterized protein family UPF0047 n=1 Tax=Carpediemonas membranifera TaxID=201153 RepID=A0A8J6AW26_9EUKA|nr:Uncharacterized protein family UPF0047 [Carpediemonas membranifera]|eukprot:KAG9389673.1 Uncharacterized protein family UPF0047 [Carpediemonas membranifera]